MTKKNKTEKKYFFEGYKPYKKIIRGQIRKARKNKSKYFFNDEGYLIVEEKSYKSETGWLVIKTYGGSKATVVLAEPYNPNPPYKYIEDGCGEPSDDFLKED